MAQEDTPVCDIMSGRYMSAVPGQSVYDYRYSTYPDYEGVNSAEDCAVIVKQDHPDAIGILFYKWSDVCVMLLDADPDSFQANGDYESCIFPQEAEETTETDANPRPEGSQTCSSAFDTVNGMQHVEGGVCMDMNIVDIDECLCECASQEDCSGIDFNLKEEPWMGCHCWKHTQEITTENLITNFVVNNYKKTTGPPSTDAETDLLSFLSFNAEN